MPLVPQKSVARRKQLAEQGIRTADDLALWARRRGLLSVYLKFEAPLNIRSDQSYWQVIRPGYETDPSDVQHLGNKTFLANDRKEKIVALQNAIAWLSLTYGVDKWVGIAGIPNALFPDPTAKALREVCPSLQLTNIKGKLTLSPTL